MNKSYFVAFFFLLFPCVFAGPIQPTYVLIKDVACGREVRADIQGFITSPNTPVVLFVPDDDLYSSPQVPQNDNPIHVYACKKGWKKANLDWFTLETEPRGTYDQLILVMNIPEKFAGDCFEIDIVSEKPIIYEINVDESIALGYKQRGKIFIETFPSQRWKENLGIGIIVIGFLASALGGFIIKRVKIKVEH